MKARKSWAMAYCGMAAALSVALMLLGAVVPVLMFIAPAVASLLIATVCVEGGRTMALAAYFVLTTNDDEAEVRTAGSLYMICTHTGTLSLFALFSLLAAQTGSFLLPQAASLAGSTPFATAVLLLALLGFGL